MNEKNRHSQPFIMVLSVTIVLLVVSQFNTEIKLFGFQTKKIEPITDILQKEKIKKVPLPAIVVNHTIIAKDSTEYALRQIDVANIYEE